MSAKTLIELPDDLNEQARAYQSDNGMTFVGVVRKGLTLLLKSEGYIPKDEDEDEALNRILKEIRANGLTIDELEKAVSEILERKVCNA